MGGIFLGGLGMSKFLAGGGDSPHPPPVEKTLLNHTAQSRSLGSD